MVEIAPHLYKKLSWLWFLPALFMDSNINYPLVAWSQRRHAGKPLDAHDLKIIVGQLVMFFLWNIPLTIIPKNDMGHKSLRPMIMILIAVYAAYYFSQILLTRPGGHRYCWIIKLIGPAATLLLNTKRDGANQDTMYGLFAMVNYDLVFMAQGAIDTIYKDEMDKFYNDMSKTVLMPFMLIIFGLNLSMCSPTIYHNEGFLFFYPLYEPTWAQGLHSLGSFYYTYFISWYMKMISNEVFNKTVFDVFVNGSMVAYIMHYLWIVLSVKLIVRPYELDFTEGAFITFICTEICIVLFHYFLKYINKKLKKKKT